MAILKPLKRLSECFLILTMLYLSIDGMCVLTTFISSDNVREGIEGLMVFLITTSFALSLSLKFTFRTSKTILESFFLCLSLCTLLGLSFLGNQESTTLIIVIYLVLNAVLFLVQKIIIHKKQKQHNLIVNDKGGV